MNENINTKEYWEGRFSSNDWEECRGRWQTEMFARTQLKLLNIPSGFEGTILDFGCGLGDAIPVYRENFPNAKLIGLDISKSAIEKCRERYGEFAKFVQGDYSSVPEVDIIIASNVFEHLSNDLEVAKALLTKCKTLHIVVPYRESPLCVEHVNSYDEGYFLSIGETESRVYPCAGWTPYGLRGLYWNIYIKNLYNYLCRRPLKRRNMQIIFTLDGYN